MLDSSADPFSVTNNQDLVMVKLLNSMAKYKHLEKGSYRPRATTPKEREVPDPDFLSGHVAA